MLRLIFVLFCANKFCAKVQRAHDTHQNVPVYTQNKMYMARLVTTAIGMPI